MPSPQWWDEVLMELYELAGSPGVRVVEDYAKRDPDAGSLSKSTVSELLKGKTNPRRASVEAFVLGCLYYARTRRPPVVLPDGQDVSDYWMDRYDQTAGADMSRSRSVAEDRAHPAPLDRISFGVVDRQAIVLIAYERCGEVVSRAVVAAGAAVTA